jgi:hypothetical protein
MGSAAKHLSIPPKAFTASAVTVRPACQLSKADVSGLTALSLLLHDGIITRPQVTTKMAAIIQCLFLFIFFLF